MPEIDAPNAGPSWACWRIAASPLCSGMEELERAWSLEDIADANEYLDASEDARRAAQEVGETMPREGQAAGADLSRAPDEDTQAEIDRTLAAVRAMQHRDPNEVLGELSELAATAED